MTEGRMTDSAPTYTTAVTIRLTAEQRAELDALCSRWGTSQAATVTRAVRFALEVEQQQ